MSRRFECTLGLLILLLGALCHPQIRSVLQERMLTHTTLLVYAPVFIGWCVSKLIHKNLGVCNRNQAENPPSLSAWLFFVFSLTYWMLPTVMEAVVSSLTMQNLRMLMLLVAGCCLYVGLQYSHAYITLFFIWNLVTMLLLQGILFLNSPSRVCNVYLLSDQQDTAKMLILTSAALGMFTVHSMCYVGSRSDPLKRPPGTELSS